MIIIPGGQLAGCLPPELNERTLGREESCQVGSGYLALGIVLLNVEVDVFARAARPNRCSIPQLKY
jgi:hypothetical protein